MSSTSFLFFSTAIDSRCPYFDYSNLSMSSRQLCLKFSRCLYFRAVTSIFCVAASIAGCHTTLYWNQLPIPFIEKWRLNRGADLCYHCLSFCQCQHLLRGHSPAWLELRIIHLAFCPWWCWYWHWFWVGSRMIIADLYCFEAQKMCHSCNFYCPNTQ